jgi:hypothetical protein
MNGVELDGKKLRITLSKTAISSTSSHSGHSAHSAQVPLHIFNSLHFLFFKKSALSTLEPRLSETQLQTTNPKSTNSQPPTPNQTHNSQTTNHQTKRTTNAQQTNKQTNKRNNTNNTIKACGMTRQSDYGRPLGPSVSVSA